jgi:hypothetical protein
MCANVYVSENEVSVCVTGNTGRARVTVADLHRQRLTPPLPRLLFPDVSGGASWE